MRVLLAGVALTATLAAGDRSRHRVEFDTAETVDFVDRGTIRIDDSFGELRVEGWDKRKVEIAVERGTNRRYKAEDTWKGRQHLAQVRVETSRSGDELLIKTRFPDRGLFSMFRGKTNLRLHYTVKVPSGSKLSIRHSVGEVVIRNVKGDVDVSNGVGEVSLRLPRDQEFDIDARARIGDVSSDFSGRSRRRNVLGAEFRSRDGDKAPRIHARVGVGEIRIDRD